MFTFFCHLVCNYLVATFRIMLSEFFESRLEVDDLQQISYGNYLLGYDVNCQIKKSV
jgi:hypothetical protein